MTPEAEMVYRDIALPYALKPWQKRVKADPHRFKVIVAGGRSGKTTLAVDWLVTEAPQDDMRLGDSLSWYVAPTYTQAEDIAWDKLKLNIRPLQAQGLVKRIYEGDMSVELLGGQWIQLKGGDNPDSLRGVKLRRLVLDEYAVMKPDVWDEVLSPRTSDYKAPVMFIGTPKGMNHFRKLALMEDERDEETGQFLHPDWKTFYVKTSEAGTLDPEEIARARRDMDPRSFRQEYEASFETFGGRVYTDFDRTKHVPAEPIQFIPGAEYDCGMDFGWSSPSYVCFANIDAQENVTVFAEYIRRETPIPTIGLAIKAQVPGHLPELIACDPAGAAKSEAMGLDAVSELRAIFGHRVVRYRSNYPGVIQDGVNVVRKWLRNGKLKISKTCPHLIQALETYRYPDPKDDVQSELPLKDGISDHPCFIAGTQIVTEAGERPIESIKRGDRVLTRQGFRRVACAGMTSESADVVTASFSDGRTVTATPNHPFYVAEKGFIPLDTLRYHDKMYIWDKQSLTGELTTGGIQSQRSGLTGSISGPRGIRSLASAISTGRFGRTLTGRFPRTTISTTRTAIRSITTSRILSFARRLCITPNRYEIGQATWPTSLRFAPSPWPGIAPKRAASGIGSMAERLTKSAPLWSRLASIAGSGTGIFPGAIRTDIARTPASQVGDAPRGLTTSLTPAPSAARRSWRISTPSGYSAPAPALFFLGTTPSGKSPVYSLEVEGVHEYYANGVLVSNCDALRYLLAYRFPLLKSVVEAL